MEKISAVICYKTKIKSFADNEGEYIDYKVNVTKSDCNLKPHEHAYYNCDMFNSMLKRATLSAQNNKTWCRLSELPENITIDTSKFMAVVTIKIEV